MKLKHTSDHETYKANADNPVKKLSYWKEIKKAYNNNNLVEEDILPLQKR